MMFTRLRLQPEVELCAHSSLIGKVNQVRHIKPIAV